MSDPLAWLPALLQTSDALFPTGAYAHSLGFEEFVRLSGTRDETGLRAFVHGHLLPALRTQELPYLRFVHDAADRGDLAEVCALDWEISAWKLARETREASTQIGRRRLAALRAIHDLPLYSTFAESITQDQAAGHHLTVSALQATGEGYPLDAALGAWLYQTIAGACGAALKLIRIGQDGCQRIVRGALAHAPEILQESLTIERETAGWFDPLLEIASMRHEFANERLFIS